MFTETKLQLYNAKNDLKDLNDLETVFSVNPEGLGVSVGNNLFNSKANFKSSGIDVNMQSLKVNLFFGLGDEKSEMEEFNNFVNFLNHPPYRLVYTTDSYELMRGCVLSELTKSDINSNLVLLEQMTLDFTTPFYKEISETYTPEPDVEGDGKIYSNYYVTPYVYESDYNGKSGVFSVINNSKYIGTAKGSPVEVTVHGPCVNPYWEILDGSKILQSDGFLITIPEGYRLVVSSIVQNQRAKLIAPDDTTSDVYQQQDLSRSNFIMIPEGYSTLAFHNVSKATFKYREEYITV